MDFEFSVPVTKSDPLRRELHGIIYRGDVLDTANDFMRAETVRKMTHDIPSDIKLDVEHDGKALHASHARVVEKFFDEKDAASHIVVKFSPQAWAQLVASGKVKGFSIFGKAEKRVAGFAKNDKGETVSGTEIVNPTLDLISLVARPANRTQGPLPIAKSDIPAWAQELIASTDRVAAQIETIKAEQASRLKKSGPSSDSMTIEKSVRAEHDARRAIRIEELRSRHLAKSSMLEKVWSAEGASLFPAGERRQREAELARELDDIEAELSTLTKTAIDFDSPARSAFAHRGGQSVRFAGSPLGGGVSDSAYEPRSASVKKAEAEIDLNFMKI